MSQHPHNVLCEVFCVRCENTFQYVRKRRPRMYCEECRDLEREEHKASLRSPQRRLTLGQRIARGCL